MSRPRRTPRDDTKENRYSHAARDMYSVLVARRTLEKGGGE